jgi:hypothetical protein
MYDDFSIELARKRGAPDPEGNAARANALVDLIHEERLQDAAAVLDGITDPVIRRDLEILIRFNSTCRCIQD